jgi:hypothetical protein
MGIQENWLNNFREIVKWEISRAGGRERDGYRAVATKSHMSEEYVYQIYKQKPKADGSFRTPGRAAAKLLGSTYAGNRERDWIDYPTNDDITKNIRLGNLLTYLENLLEEDSDRFAPYLSDALSRTEEYCEDLISGRVDLDFLLARTIESGLGLKEFFLDILPAVPEELEVDDRIKAKRVAIRNKSDELVIPQFVDAGGSMGKGLLLRDQPGEIRGWTVSQEWVAKNIKSHTGASNLCIVTGFGDSMKGMFNSGDPLVVDRGVTTVDFDAVYFFRVDNEGFIKRLQRIPGEGLRVLSENKKYESWTIKPDMDFEVFGRVLKAWQGEEF